MKRCCAYLLSCTALVSAPAVCQVFNADPGIRKLVDERGIDLLSGTSQQQYPIVSIGDPQNGGIIYQTNMVSATSIKGAITSYDGQSFYVMLGFKTYVFRNMAWYATGPTSGIINGFNFQSVGGDNASLTRSGDTWTLVSPAGEIAVFEDALGRHLPYTGSITDARNSDVRNGNSFAQLVRLTMPNGETTRYNTVASISGSFRWPKVVSIANNSGYQIRPGETVVTAINNAVDTCSPQASACTGLQQSRSVYFGSGATNETIIRDPASQQLTFSSTAASWIPFTKVTFPSGRMTNLTGKNYVYQEAPGQAVSRNRVSSWSNGQATWTYDYVDTDRATRTTLTVTDPLGRQRKVYIESPLSIFLAAGVSAGKPKIVKDVDELGREVRYEYGDYDNVSRIILPEGNSIAYEYDQWGNRTKVTWQPKPGSGLSPAVQISSFAENCPSQITCSYPRYVIDPKGNRTDYVRDPVHGQMLSETGPAAAPGQSRPQTRYGYTPMRAWFRNAAGTLVESSEPIYKLTSISTCTEGEASTCVGTRFEKRTIISYGQSGVPNNLLPTSRSVMAGDGSIISTTTYAYNAYGDLVTEDGPLPGSADTTRYEYDVLRRRTAVISPDPDGSGPLPSPAMRIDYDADGRVLAEVRGTVPSGATGMANFTEASRVGRVYDVPGRMVKESWMGESIQAVTQNGYDAVDRLECTAVRMNAAAYAVLPDACTVGTAASDGADRVTRNVYDLAGQLVQVRKGVGTPLEQAYATYSYTPNGKRDTIIDANGNRARLEYDGFDRLAKWTFPTALRPAAFNPASAATALASAGSLNASDYEQYGYDGNGNRTTVRRRDGRVLTFGYDAGNRMASKVVPDGCAPIQVGACPLSLATRDVYYGYDLGGHQTFARFDGANGEGVTDTYDALGRLASSTSALGGTSRTLGYMYDVAGNRTRITQPDGTYFAMAYDDASRMRSASWWSPAAGTVPFLAITYDGLGRRSDVNRGSSYTGYGYDGLSRLTAQSQRFASGSGNLAAAFGYNPAGQMTSRTLDNGSYAFTGSITADRSYATNGLNQYVNAGSASFQYDANGNLVSDGTKSYGYDAENRLVSASGGVGLTYDPMGRLWQIAGGTSGVTQFLYDGDALVAEYGGAGGLLRRYMHGPNVDEPILVDEGAALNCSGTRFLHTDHQSSVIALADCSGNRTAVNAYDEYGIPNATNTGRFQYTGQAWLPELGMYHYKARIYSPTLGRFLQTDPIGYDDQVNLYAYVANDPVNNTDPTGEECSAPRGGTRCTNPAATTATAATAVAAREGVGAERARSQYREATGKLAPNDSAGRSAAKASARAATPPITRGVVEGLRPGLGPKPGSGGTANRTNVGADRLAGRLGTAGRVAGVAGVAIGVARVATSDNPGQEAVRVGGGMAGAVAGAELLAPVGGAIGGPWGAAAGGVVGGLVGGFGGEKAVDKLLDW